jgi:RHS repeat-associated protein
MMLRMLGWFETFSYDPAGNRTGMDQFTPPTQNVNAAYSYDQANQLLVEATGSSGGATGPGYVSTYAYDGSGNWTTRLDEIAFVSPFSRQYTTTYAHDNAGELTGNSAAWTGYPTGGSGASAATYTYDAAGNRLTANVGGVVTTYSWDYENRLIGATFSPLATLTSGILTNLYSSDGLRQGYADHTGITTLTYDILSQNVYRRDVLSTAATERYTNRPEAYGSPISVCRVATATGAIVTNLFYNSVDGTANISSLAAAGDNATAGNYVLYPAFGAGSANVPTIPSPLSTQPFQYMGAVGYYTDPSTGLIYVKARWYDPLTGIWLSEDPIGFDGGVNAYEYVGNKPVGTVDPSGLRTPCPPGSCIPKVGQHCDDEDGAKGQCNSREVLLGCCCNGTTVTTDFSGTITEMTQYCALCATSCHAYSGETIDYTSDIPPGASAIMLVLAAVAGTGYTVIKDKVKGSNASECHAVPGVAISGYHFTFPCKLVSGPNKAIPNFVASVICCRCYNKDFGQLLWSCKASSCHTKPRQ